MVLGGGGVGLPGWDIRPVVFGAGAIGVVGPLASRGAGLVVKALAVPPDIVGVSPQVAVPVVAADADAVHLTGRAAPLARGRRRSALR